MGFFTQWFLADEREAEALANMWTANLADDNWPDLTIKNVGLVDFMLLRGILQKQSGSLSDVEGKPLFQTPDGDVFVSQVLPEFVAELAGVKEADIGPLAAAWNKSEQLSDWDVNDLANILRELAAFARRAQRDEKQVLDLAVRL